MPGHRVFPRWLSVVVVVGAAGAALTRAQDTRDRRAAVSKSAQGAVPGGDVDAALIRSAGGDLRDVIERYSADRASLERCYNVAGSAARRDRLREFYRQWRTALGDLPFDTLDSDGRIDWVLFRGHLEYELRRLDLREQQRSEAAPLVPFACTVIDLEEARRRLEPVDAEKSADALTTLATRVGEARKAVEAAMARSRAEHSASSPASAPGSMPADVPLKKSIVNRAAGEVDALRDTLRRWNEFYSGYDPVFTWWAAKPYESADKALADYAALLREKIVGLKPGEEEPIIGDPIGREALAAELAREMIAYAPEELIAMADREFAWCEGEMRRAARDAGFGDDWHKALEHVKTLHVEPGRQPALIRDLAREAERFLDDHDLITIPELARETWRMEMMSPRSQLVNPFFTGGETISVSFPTNTMTHEQKLMSMRGNNVHFSRATVFHELIPGHHLQGFMLERHRSYRAPFATPFWLEGWAVYWETLLWDLGYAKSPENRIGMLFWRMHRCARIRFSLSFHLEKMTPQECIDYLVTRVGHERENATAEVRRSFNGSYGPLYQCGYMIGALQFRALHRDLVDSGRMTNRQFHDAILRGGSIPVEMVRARLSGANVTREYRPEWRFYGPSPATTP